LSGESERIKRLLKMAERLMEAIEADIEALNLGQPLAMRTTDPEMQRLSALYGREAQGFSGDAVKSLSPTLRQRFVETTARFRELLRLHARLIMRVRNASEGMIKAIADEVDRQLTPTRTYAPPQSAYVRPAHAMIYNKVV
jgi:hypothetical protein